MGTLLQEFGHDIVLLYFIDKVLKEQQENLFYVVNPATGPRVDIHFWNPEKDEYTSAYNASGNSFVPEFSLRFNIEQNILEKINEAANYQNLEWYQNLSKKLGKELLTFIMELYTDINGKIETFPDIIGINEAGQETIWAELKFEGFGKDARDSVLKQFTSAQERNVPFYLVIPQSPIYGRKITDAWIEKNLPPEIKVYKFTSESQAVVPKRDEIQFKEVRSLSLCQRIL